MKTLQVDKDGLEKLINKDLAEIANSGSLSEGSAAIGEFCGCQVQVRITKDPSEFFDVHLGLLTATTEPEASVALTESEKLKQLKYAAFDRLQVAVGALYDYAGACELGPERIKAFAIYEAARLAPRAE